MYKKLKIIYIQKRVNNRPDQDISYGSKQVITVWDSPFQAIPDQYSLFQDELISF